MDVRRLHCCICIVSWLQGSNGWTLLVISSNGQNIKPRVQKNDADIVWGRWTSDVQRKNNKCHFENQPVVLTHFWFIALCCNTTCWISPPPRWRVPSRRSCFPNLRPKGHHPSFSRKRMKEIWDYSPTCNPVTFIADDWFISLLLIVFAGFMHVIPSSGGPSKWVPPGPILSQVLGKQGLDRVIFSKNEATC